MFLFDSKGEFLCRYNSISRFTNGFACVEIDEKNRGYIDTTGQLVFYGEFRRIGDFYSDYAYYVDENGDNILIDRYFNAVHNFGKQHVEGVSGNRVIISLENHGNYTVTDIYGNIIAENLNFAGFSTYWMFDNYYYYGSYNEVTVKSYDDKITIKEVRAVENCGKYVLIFKDEYFSIYDEDLELVKKIEFDEDILFLVRQDMYRMNLYITFDFYKIDKRVNYLFDPFKGELKRLPFLDKYETIKSVSKEHISVSIGDKYGLITLNGKVIFEPNNDMPYIATDDGYFIDNDKVVIYNKRKKIIYQNEELYWIGSNRMIPYQNYLPEFSLSMAGY